MSSIPKIAIIGAGPAGLAAALELKAHGIESTVYESHSKPGGCASYFRRQIAEERLLFDAGATVVWSLNDGDFFKKKLKEWKLPELPFHKHNFHRYTIDAQTFDIHSHSEGMWIQSLKENFPDDALFIEKNFPFFFKVSRKILELIESPMAEPFLELRALLINTPLLLKAFSISDVIQLLKIPRDFSKFLDQEKLSAKFRNWVEMTLLITLQAQSHEVDTLYALMSLCFFPLGAGALEGGMATLFDAQVKALNKDVPRVHFRKKVTNILLDKGYFLEIDGFYQGPFQGIMLTSPRWSSKKFFKNELFEENTFTEERQCAKTGAESKLWSATVAYLAIKDCEKIPREAFNHQVSKGKESYYISVSRAGDPLRGSTKLRSATMSTHTPLNEWSFFEEYKKSKDFKNRESYLEKKILKQNLFCEIAQESLKTEIIYSDLGTPKSFLHYTQRESVGGIPLSKNFSFLKSPTQRTQYPFVYQLGDTAFPGQSIVNTSIGAIEAVRKLLNDYF